MTWWMYAIIASLSNAMFSEVNRVFKVGPFRLNFWQLTFSTLVLLPAIYHVSWPDNSMFYVVAFLNGLAMTFGTVVKLRVAAEQNGRVAVLTLPIKIIAAYLIWSVIDSAFRAEFVADPWRGVGSLAMLALGCWALTWMFRHDKTKNILLVWILLAGLSFASVDILIKRTIATDLTMQIKMAYVFVAMLSGAGTSGLYLLLRQTRRELIQPGMLKAAVLLMVAGIITLYAIVNSIGLAPNPAYTGAITLLSYVWLFIYYRVFKIPDNADPYAGFVLVLAAFGLILFVNG